MRNMIDENKKAFGNLINQLSSKGNFNIKAGKRYFITNDDEKNWLKNCEIEEVYTVLPHISAVRLRFNEKIYISIIGTELDSSLMENVVIQEEELNSGISTLLIANNILKIDPQTNGLEFYNEIMFQHEENSYTGHDYKEVLKYLETINFFLLPDNSVLKNESLKRILCYIFSNNKQHLILNFSDDLLESISEISLVGSSNISFGLTLSCLFSTNFKHAFLEVYRLVERIFPVSYLKEFHERVETDLNFIEFSTSLENITKWRPREEDALEKIFNSFTSTTEYYFNIFFTSSDDLKDQSNHKYFYKLRNSIVHFRTSHEETDLTDSQWNKLIMATFYLVDENYSNFENLLAN